jgi:hypothetical protein
MSAIIQANPPLPTGDSCVLVIFGARTQVKQPPDDFHAGKAIACGEGFQISGCWWVKLVLNWTRVFRQGVRVGMVLSRVRF